jgi:Na+-transporting NADH:ubiquinone oxidoreductase subunit C
MQREGTLYTIIFTTLVCAVCSVLVSGAAVGLRDRQIANQILDRQTKVLLVAGLMKEGDRLSKDEIQNRFQQNIQPRIIQLDTGEYDDSIPIETFDQQRYAKDTATSKAAPDNEARVRRLPNHALVYHVIRDGAPSEIVLPIEGMGLWSILYGYLALDKDTTTIRGITFYEHGETPGLGGEIDNPRWKALWPGRKAFDENWTPKIEVIKGQAGSPEKDPHRIDGLSGATLTGRGVSNLLKFWLGENGFGPYLKKVREQGV